MSALLPPPGGPLPQSARVAELLRAARHHLEVSRERLERVRGYAADMQADDVDRMHTRVLTAERERSLELWAEEVARLEQLTERMSMTARVVR